MLAAQYSRGEISIRNWIGSLDDSTLGVFNIRNNFDCRRSTVFVLLMVPITARVCVCVVMSMVTVIGVVHSFIIEMESNEFRSNIRQ